jgi:hypothetical protein
VVATSSAIAIPSAVITAFSVSFTLGATDANNGLSLEIFTTSALTVTSKYFAISDIQLERGSVATPFEHRPYGLELSLCQRYFQRPAGFMAGGVETTTIASFGYSFPVSMRAAPNFTAAATTADIRVSGATTAGIAGTWSALVTGTESAGFSFARTAGSWTANIPAFLNQSTAIASLSAEL